MKHSILTTLAVAGLLGLTLATAPGCAPATGSPRSENGAAVERQPSTADRVMSGTTLDVKLINTISSESASANDVWRGRLVSSVATQNGGLIPAGSFVSGSVAAVSGARRGSRAMIELTLLSIRVNDRDIAVTAGAEPVIAGSTRARNLGAIAGGAAAGALLGKLVGDGKNAAVGGVLGGAAATGVVAGSRGYQVVLQPGTVLRFTVSQTVALR